MTDYQDTEGIKKKLEEQEKTIEEYTNILKRLQADFENYVKRTDKEKEEFANYSNHKLVSKLLNVVDDFEKALELTKNNKEIADGLEIVYNEILGFSGSETYFVEENFTGLKFHELVNHFQDGAPYGIRKADGQIVINPKIDTVMGEGDALIMLAQDDSTIKFKKNAEFKPVDHPYKAVVTEKKAARELILGWHTIASVVISQFADYLEKGSVVDIIIDSPSDEVKGKIAALRKELTDISINLIETNPLSMENLRAPILL